VKAHEKWIVECAKDLAASKGSALVVAGHRQPLAVHLLALAINSSLGSIGKTVAYLPAAEPKAGTIADLAKALHDGKVDTLVILGGNPVYSAPADLQWVQAQGKAGTVIRLGYYEDESFPVKGWQLPQAHYLESWGDARTADGTVVPIQPLIEPLFGGVTEIEVLARIGGVAKSSPYDLVRETFGTDEEKWKRFLHDGFLAGSAHTPMDVRQPAGSVGANDYKPLPAPTKEKLEIVFHRDYSVDDGRFNNNGWLQEMPDPISKMTWENVVLMSAKTAKELGVFLDDTEGNNLHASLVQVELGGQKIIGPVWTQPGMADYTLGLALGYGRRRTGRVGEGSGFNAYALRTSGAPHIASGAKLTVLGATQLLATTQSHWSMEGRPIIREATARQYREQPHFADGMDLPKPPSTPADGSPVALYPNPLDKLKAGATHQWGMSIDLNACVGCSACVMACQSENNVPIVGKDQVSRNREMHWLRIDRYYAGDPTKSLDAQIADPQVVTQPMLCQHCESAPCESVCPVNATVHDEEGLNVMVYNRCVGTRYCSNNCPYKVRRFNYFDFNKRPLNDLYRSPFGRNKDGQWELLRWLNNVDKGTVPDDQWELLKLAKNPDVSVRMRGVMEKCTFCIQRIEHAKITQKVKAGASGDVEVPDDTIKTACQQACPAEAIVFGNVKDKHSRVSQFKEQPRDYAVLEFLGTKPRLTYLARIRNPNPAMPDAYEAPLTSKEFESKMGGGHAPDPAHSPKASPEKKGAH
jgi:molybdopterin-containing oxidoreductase family iron-sulfur binding subunit